MFLSNIIEKWKNAYNLLFDSNTGKASFYPDKIIMCKNKALFKSENFVNKYFFLLFQFK